MINFNFDFSKLEKRLDKITSAAEKGTRPAAQAGAQVFYEEMEQRAPEGTEAEHYFYGQAAKKAAKGNKKALAYLFTRGNLKKSIYQYFNKRLSADGKAVYSITWNRKKAPYGKMVEEGTSRSAAQSFQRSAYDAVRRRAVGAVKSRMRQEIKKGLNER